ncbi:hypothetical protein XBKB1_4380008 [Xenorhabdus bovienii str. kraussei Becker Underwood]|uniref:Uncharacterized protein n=1 Tax=Xenorhabdus bovienii str. kraussei Becker Underwood TaxID=1398204 RepID=A0A077PZ98_XENBV|nr:hypothetical protein XBKB1_4380008 [Xenorhabdus bovienii str. kraussei Becker Underwood]
MMDLLKSIRRYMSKNARALMSSAPDAPKKRSVSMSHFYA